MNTPKIIVTGANGFVGSSVCRHLFRQNVELIRVVRTRTCQEEVGLGSLTTKTNWSSVLKGGQTVVHLAAKVHEMDVIRGDGAKAYTHMNVDVAINLAKQAVDSGVRRFVFISTIKVNGESSGVRPFRVEDPPNPQGPYAYSKFVAEQELIALGKKSGMEIVIVRPPLVYGPGVRANFLKLMQLVHRGVPIPLASVKSKRSFIGVENLASFITCTVFHPEAKGKVWLISDGEDVTIGELIRLIAKAMNKSAKILPVPTIALSMLGVLLGKKAGVERVLTALEVDSSPALQILGWTPPYTLEEGVQFAVRHFVNINK